MADPQVYYDIPAPSADKTQIANVLALIIASALVVLSVAGYWVYQKYFQAAKAPAPAEEAAVSTPLTPPVFKVGSPSPFPSISPPPPPATLDLSLDTAGSYYKYTYDFRSGAGRQVGSQTYLTQKNISFTKLETSWTPILSLCFPLSVNETVSGKEIEYKLTLDGKDSTGNLSSSGTLAPRTPVTVCRDLSQTPSAHTVALALNPSKTLRETDDSNNTLASSYTMTSDPTAPTFTVLGPIKQPEGTCFQVADVGDNTTPTDQLAVFVRMDNGDWHLPAAAECNSGAGGEAHTFEVKVTDGDGNTATKSIEFTNL